MVEQLVPPIRTVAEMSTAPKFLPVRVKLAPPLSGAFAGMTEVTAGESYEKAWENVPITSSSMLAFSAVPTPKLAVQTMLVAVIHRFDAHTVVPTRTLAAGAAPKLVPDRVRRAPPSVGPFLGARTVTTPWSYVKADRLLPETDANDTVAVKARPNPGCGAHRRKESVTQTFEPHEVAPNRTDGVWFVEPKFVPVKKAVLAPVDGVFAGVKNVTTGASYVKPLVMKPGTCVTEAESATAAPWPAGWRHKRRFTEVHDDVWHAAPATATVTDVSLTPKFVPTTVTLAPPIAGPLNTSAQVITGAS
jgi:hypothetical protein